MYLGADSTYSAEAESAAFRKLHTLSVAVAQLKAQGNVPGLQAVLPYFRAAIEEYRRAGATDPAYLSSQEQLLLSLGNVGSGVVSALDTVSNKLIVGGIVIAAILFLWKR